MSSSGLSTVRKQKHHQPAVKPLRVLICAASSIIRAGLERLLEPQPSLHLVSAINSADALPPAIAAERSRRGAPAPRSSVTGDTIGKN